MVTFPRFIHSKIYKEGRMWQGPNLSLTQQYLLQRFRYSKIYKEGRVSQGVNSLLAQCSPCISTQLYPYINCCTRVQQPFASYTGT